jgi:uncharacterized protein with ParB-like and HNH nuclease domain
MNNNIFFPDEITWLAEHKKVAACIDYLLEDSQNVNALDDGTPDNEPYLLAQKAAHITIEVAQKNIIKGPYNAAHFALITKHYQETSTFDKKTVEIFWQLFSFNCGCSYEEDNGKPVEQIYMEAMIETLRELKNIDKIENNQNTVYNLNTNSIEQIKAKGVKTRFT